MDQFLKTAITALGVVSPVGSTLEDFRSAFLLRQPQFSTHSSGYIAGTLVAELESELGLLKKECKHETDRVVLQAILAGNKLKSGIKSIPGTDNLMVNLGSSRGATESLEAAYAGFASGERILPRTSPTTTLGALSSSVAQLFSKEVFPFNHSMTCSSSLIAVGNALAWLRSGMARRAIVGGSEAPLTDFTIGQMSSLGIYTKNDCGESFPVRPLEVDPVENSFALGEGAALFLIEPCDGDMCSQPLAIIDSFGFGYEALKSQTSLTGMSLKAAMLGALNTRSSSAPIDAIVTHATGTTQGDSAELKAIRSIFGEETPLLVSNKWLMGHTMGAAGGMNIVTALAMFGEKAENFDFPYQIGFKQYPRDIRTVMINSAGFGGVANCLIISRPD